MTRSPRRAALDAMTAFEEKGDRLLPHLVEALDAPPHLEGPARGQAAALVNGALRRTETLDHLLAHFVRAPRSRVPRRLWTLLRLAVFEQLYLTRTPAHATVHEWVETAKGVAAGGAPRMVNGVLRNLTRAGRLAPPPAPLTARYLPITAEVGFHFDEDVFPNPNADPDEYLAAVLSHPAWLLRRWRLRHGMEEAFRRGLAGNADPRVIVRTNPLRRAARKLAAELREADVEATCAGLPGLLRLEHSGPPRRLPGYAEGRFQPQDVASARSVQAALPLPGERVLDLCAAPGAKTTQTAEIQGDSGYIVAADRSRRRLQRLPGLATRLGLRSLHCIVADGTRPPFRRDGFDLVIVDAPCTNTAVLARRPERRRRLLPEAPAALAAEQARLLNAAAPLVRPGGRILYATCSLEPEENEEGAAAFLARHANYHKVAERTDPPSIDGLGGGYFALLVRAEP